MLVEQEIKMFKLMSKSRQGQNIGFEIVTSMRLSGVLRWFSRWR